MDLYSLESIYVYSYEESCEELKWPTLVQRRQFLSACQTNNVHHNPISLNMMTLLLGHRVC